MVTASTAPPGPRSVLVPKESVRAVRRGFARRSSELMTAAKRPPAPVDPWAMREHRPSPGTSSSDANNLSKFLSAHCNGKDPPNKERIRYGEHVGYKPAMSSASACVATTSGTELEIFTPIRSR
jgi:hypothetical protein